MLVCIALGMANYHVMKNKVTITISHLLLKNYSTITVHNESWSIFHSIIDQDREILHYWPTFTYINTIMISQIASKCFVYANCLHTSIYRRTCMLFIEYSIFIHFRRPTCWYWCNKKSGWSHYFSCTVAVVTIIKVYNYHTRPKCYTVYAKLLT